MTRDEIIRMAKESGFNLFDEYDDSFKNSLERFANLVAAHERQECAVMAYKYDSQPWKHTPAYAHVADMVSIEIGKAIIRRGVQDDQR